MNTQRYRLVYNRIRNCLMAVAEIITSHGKTSGETRASSSPFKHTPSKKHWLQVSFTGIAWASYLLLTPALHAQIIADPDAPGHQQPTVGITANGVPQVDIQTPNATGLSRNVYRQFDVPQNGVILNNSREEVQTQIGGLVNRNPHLINSGPAKTILNEVRSSDPSVLRGFMEVAGQSAHVIVSNPSGITCNGCGFINAHRSTLTTGTPMIDGAGNLESYRITAGTISIFGDGLNDEKTYYTDILARAIEINAKIHAKKLTGIMGANTIPVKESARPDGTQGEKHLGAPVPIAPDRDHKNPAFALDVAELGGLYAQHAYLIGTEAGLGVRTAKGSEFNIGEFQVNHAGEIVHRGVIKAEGNAKFYAAEGIAVDTDASIAAHGNLSMSTQASIANKGTLAAKGNFDLFADGLNSTITSYAGSSLMAGIGDDGKSLSTPSQLTVRATQQVSLNGTNKASGDLIIKSNAINLSNTKTSETSAINIKLLGLNEGLADNIDVSDAKLIASNALTAQARYRLTTDRAIVSAQDFFLTANDFFNIGGTLTQTSANDWLLNFIGNVNNTDGTIKANARQFNIHAANIDNTRGTLDHQGAGNVSLKANQLQSTASKITTANTLTLHTDQTIFDQATVEVGHIDLTSRLFSNRSGLLKLIGTGLQTFNISGLFDNTQGTLLSNGNLQFTLGQLDGISLLNTGGTISALVDKTLNITASGQIDNSEKDGLQGGSLLSGGKMMFEAQSIANAKGKIQSLQDSIGMTLLNGGINNAGGMVEAKQGLAIDSYGIDNTLGRLIAQALDINNHQSLFNNTNGTVKSSTVFKLDNGELNNHNGQITSSGPMTIKSRAFYNDNGWVQSNQDLNINTQGHLLRNTNSAEKRGLISLGSLTLKTGGLYNKAGYLFATGPLSVEAQGISNERGTINSHSNIQFNAASLDNAYGGIIALGGLTATLQNTFNNLQGSLIANQAVDITAKRISNHQGWLSSAHSSLSLKALGGEIRNTSGGTISALGAMTLSSLGLNNTEGQINAQTLDVNTQEKLLDNTRGKLSAKGQFALKSGELKNENGRILSDTALDLTSLALNNHRGLIQALQTLSIDTQGQTFTNTHTYNPNEQKITMGVVSLGTLTLKTGVFDNQYGRIYTTSALDATMGNFDNRYGSIYAKGQTTFNSQDFNNQYGLFSSHNKVTLSSLALDNTDGQINAQTLDINTQGQTLDNMRGKLLATHAFNLKSGELKNEHGKIISDGTLDILSLTLNNRWGWIQAKALTVDTQGQKLDNQDTYQADQQEITSGIISHGLLTLKTGLLDNQRGRLHAVGIFDATTDYFDNRHGAVHADSQATFNSNGFNNQHGIVSTLGSTTFKLQQTTLDNDDGVIESNDKLSFTGGQINNRRGKLFGKQALDIKSLVLDNQTGLIKSDKAIDIDTQGQTLINADSGNVGGIHSGGNLSLKTGEFNNRYGHLSAQGGLTTYLGLFNNTYGKLTTNGTLQFNASQINNDHGLIYAVSNANINLGVGDTFGEFNNAYGTVQTKGTLDILSGLFNNQGGAVKSTLAMNINTQGKKFTNTDSGDDGGIVGEDSVTLMTGEFDNRKGYLGSHKNLSLTGTTFFNQGGTVRSLSSAQLQAQNIYNAGGWLRAEQTLSLLLGNGLLDNSSTNEYAAGLISALNLTVQADKLLNVGSNQADQGLRAYTMDLNIHDIDNTRGLIHGDHTVTLHGRQHIDNTAGQISAGDTLKIADTPTPQVRLYSALSNIRHASKSQRITNTGGKLYAGKRFTVDSAGLTSDGQLTSLGDMNVALHGDYTNTGNVSANGALNFSTDGTFTNQALFNALTNLTLTANNLDNQALGELSAGTSLSLNIANLLTNRGLIDAPTALIKAMTLNNLGSGRIYGDNLGIAATTINNNAETVNNVTQSATIAARNGLDLGVETLNNKSDALILSLGDMAIGGELDDNNQAIGLTDTVNNGSSTIDAGGNLTFAARKLNNTNDTFGMDIGQTESYSMTYIQPQGSAKKYRRDELVWEGWSRAGQYRVKATGEIIRNFTQYNVVHQEFESQVYASDPGKIRSGGAMDLQGTQLINDKSQIMAGGAMTGDLNNLNNIDAEGKHIIKESGTAQYTWTKWYGGLRKWHHKRKWGEQQSHTPADTVTTITLPISEVQKNTMLAATAYDFDQRNAHQAGHIVEVAALSQAPQARSNSDVVLSEQPQFDITRQALSVEQGTAVSNHATSVSATPTAVEQSTTTVPSSITSVGAAPTTVGHEPSSSTTQAPISAAPREVIRTVTPNINLPTASLYKVNPPGPDTKPLIETDPRFTQYQQWLGSQALITAGSIGPNITQKRLGDGFYEQQLIRDQVTQLTGRRFLTGYQNDSDQYQALINNGVSVAQTFQLTPGIALTLEQMARLTSDIVWLVEKDVTLPDGSTTKALVPQLYVKVKEGDLKGDSTLISGDSVQFKLTGDLNNSATIAGRTLVDISAQNINNHLGRVKAGDARLSAQLDINNIGGRFEADNSMAMNAGQDINMQSTTQSDAKTSGPSTFNRTSLDRVAGVYVGRGNSTTPSTAASLIAQAGRDINLINAVVDNNDSQATSQIAFTAGRDVNLGTQKVQVEENLLADANHKHQQSSSQELGTSVNTQGNVNFQAGRDVNARAANVNSEQGGIQVNAGNNVNLVEGQQTQSLDEYHHTTSKGVLSSGSKTTRDVIESSSGMATTLSGKNVSATASNDINLKGSNAVSDQGTDFNAGNNVNVLAGQNTHRESHFVEEKKSGLMGSGGVGFTIGSQQQSTDAALTETTSNASTVGATNGNVNINAGKAYTQVGSEMIALNNENKANAGDVNVIAQAIDIKAAENTATSRTEQKSKQSGLTVAITSPVITAVQTAESMRQASEKTNNGRMKVLAAAATAAAAYNAGAAVADNPQQAGGVGISASIGSSQSSSVTEQKSTTLASSNVNATGNANFQAIGADKDSNINVTASNINAGNNASFKADNDVNFVAGQNTSEQHSSNKSSSASVGVGLSTSSGLTFNVALSKGRGKADGEDTLNTHTNVNAGNEFNVQTGNDLNMKGATAQAKKITADIGNDLNIESVQDKSTYHSEQKSVGVSVAVPIMGMGKGSASASMSKSNIDSDYLSVTQQSGFKAGDDGFDIKVKGNTDLKAGLIASTDKAAEDNKNKLETGTLTTSDLNNKAEYEASSISVGVGTSPGMGITPAGIGFGNDSDSQASTTKAGISQANIKITDEDKQKQLTGKDTEQTIADLNRDVSTDKDTSGALTNKFDATRVQNEIDAQTAITETFGQQTAQAIGTYTQRKAEEYKKQAGDLIGKATDPNNGLTNDQRQALLAEAKQHTDEAEKWDEGGRYRVAMHTIAGGLVGNIAGAVSAAAVAGAAQKLNDLQAHIADSLKDAGLPKDMANLASQLVTQTAAAGVGAVAGAATGSTVTGTSVGLNVDANNRTFHQEEIKKIDELAANDPQKKARLTAAGCALTKCYAEYPVDSEAYKTTKMLADLGASDAYQAERRQLKETGHFTYTTNGLFSDKNKDTIKQVNNTYQVTDRAIGAVQGVMGTVAAAGVMTAGCATGVTCGLGMVVAGTSVDYSQAGFQQMLSGDPTPTYGEKVLQSLGMPPEAAALTYGAVNLGATVGVAAIANQAAIKLTQYNTLARASYSEFNPNGLAVTDEVMKTSQAQVLMKEIQAGSPSLPESAVNRFAKEYIASGTTLPQVGTATQNTQLIKVVPKGDGVSATTGYWLSAEQARAISKMSPEQAGRVLGLPAKQAADMLQKGMDFHVITPKPGTAPTVFISNVANTTQGVVKMPGGAQQIIVPNRAQWTTPTPINPSTLRTLGER